MPTLVGEGIGSFIVVGYEYSLVGLEVFSFWEPPWSVIYGILSLWESLWIRWSVGSKLLHDTWVASKHLIYAVSLYQSFNASLVSSWNRHPSEGVSLLKPSAFWEPLKGFSWIVTSEWKLSWRGVPVSQHRHLHHMWSSIYSFVLPLHQLPPTPQFRRLWTNGFVESCWITILGLEKRECHWWTPHPETHLLRRTCVVYSLAPFLTKASLHLPCVFSFYI